MNSNFDLLKFGIKTFSSFQNITCKGLENIVDLVNSRTPLITIANHQSIIDDPIIWSPLEGSFESFRYTIASEEQVESFKAPLTWIKDDMKLLTVRSKARGGNKDKGTGLHQEGFFKANEILCSDENKGGSRWIHIFPEGAMIQEFGVLIGRFKPGIASLIMSCDPELALEFNHKLGKKVYVESNCHLPLPLIVPVAHFGMHNVVPMHQNPSVGQQIHVFYGKAINLIETIHNLKMKHYQSEDRLNGILSDLITHIEKCYLQFYVESLNAVYNVKLDFGAIESNEFGYVHHWKGLTLLRYAKEMLLLRKRLVDEEDDYEKIRNVYINRLRSKESFLNSIDPKEGNLTQYNKERILYNLYSTKESLLKELKKKEELSYCQCKSW